MLEQPTFAALDWPALVPGPVFLMFELRGKPGHKARHRDRIIIRPEAWVRLQGRESFIPYSRKHLILTMHYPDPATAEYEGFLKEAAGLFMNRARHNGPTDGPVSLLVHSFREIPASWSKTEKAQAAAHYKLPTSRPDWDNYGKITDALNGVVWNDDAQVTDGRVIKRYSQAPALRIEVRRMVDPKTLMGG